MTKRITNLVRRHLREKERGNRAYNRSAAALQKAREAGLALDQPVEVEVIGVDGLPQKATFALVDNFAGDAAFRATRIPHFELKKLAKNPRVVGPVSRPGGAPTAEAGA